ncbi:MAG: YncE family protein [Vulcanimicrobiota bacterium]
MKRLAWGLILLAALAGCVVGTNDEQDASTGSANVVAGLQRPPQVVLVANRTSGDVTVIDASTDTVFATITLPPAANPSRPGYVVYSAALNRIYVGDDANDRIVALAANDFSFVATLTVPMDVFHMWLNQTQLWAIDRQDKSLVVFDLITNTRLAVIKIPADLEALGGVPHDIVVDDQAAYATILGVGGGGPDVVVKYSTTTLAEVGRANVGLDPHVILHPTDNRLFVACQSTDNVFVFNRNTLAQLDVIPILGGHGVWVPPHGQSLYVTNFPGHVVGGLPGPNPDGLFAVNLNNDTAIGSLATPVAQAHNLTSTADGSKLYLTHSNAGRTVSIYTVASPTSLPVLAGQVQAGTNPFGIVFIP